MRWRRIPSFPLYEVSDTGLVRKFSGQLIPAKPQYNGYLRVRLQDEGNRYWRRVHNLVLEAFVGPRPSPRHHGDHGPDRDRTNNHLSNLRWASIEENEADKKVCESWRNSPRKASSPELVKAIRERNSNGESLRSIAKAYDLHPHSVSRIVRGFRHANT